ncbi:hypothetical protein Bhyg_06723 [Pseudolycoriella hygida]|uniref:Uncharacterized protein n=1 Tax=Pseudolycoriella hygida TaxID=35572 RepID=A0A9Q0N1C1_9DIPT|nr:hypothetical protein Bhyg_06723 [Pseudolycoriella hygida]
MEFHGHRYYKGKEIADANYDEPPVSSDRELNGPNQQQIPQAIITDDEANSLAILGQAQAAPMISIERAEVAGKTVTKRKSNDTHYVSPKKAKQTSTTTKSDQNTSPRIPTYNPFGLLNSNEDLSKLNSRENDRINKEILRKKKNSRLNPRPKKQEKCPPIIITELFKDPKGAINNDEIKTELSNMKVTVLNVQPMKSMDKR